MDEREKRLNELVLSCKLKGWDRNARTGDFFAENMNGEILERSTRAGLILAIETYWVEYPEA